MIRRRSLSRGAALLWLLTASPALAQRANRLPRVALMLNLSPLADLAGPDPVDLNARAFVHGLRDLGWVDGRSVIIERRSAERRPERLPTLLREVTELPVDVIVAFGPGMARAAKQATDTIPIVAVGPNTVAMGLASSLAQPGGNVTGLTFETGTALNGKRLELLKRAVPAATRITFIGPRPIPGRPIGRTETAAAARALGVVLSLVPVDRPEDLDAAFAAISSERPDALFYLDSPVNLGNRARIIAFAARERLPAIYAFRLFAESGGLMSYGVDIAAVARRAAVYVDKILKGAKPGDLPIEQPTRFEFVINLKTATALGVTIPRELLLFADEVIR